MNDRLQRGVWATVAIALVGAALGATGGAQAAGLITGKQIKDGTVTGADVRNQTVTGLDVADGSLTPDDYAGDTTGRPGAPGECGRDGADGVEYLYFDKETIEILAPGQVGTAVAKCDPGHVAVGGGLGSTPGRNLQLLDSAPLGTTPATRSMWVVRVGNAGTADVPVTAWALCAEVQP